MGDTFALGSDDVISLVDPPQQHVAEVNRPDPVLDLFEADRMLLERIGQEQQPLLQADGAGAGHPLDEEVAGILDRWRLPKLGASPDDRSSPRIDASGTSAHRSVSNAAVMA